MEMTMSREEPCFEVEVVAFSQLVQWNGVPSPGRGSVFCFDVH